ncbi:HEAT repeat domain-containing protein [Sediminispirochaeta bajacaliforniensis]|uniref:HEAT repeat domain-containing protein n=1 Tax=Sediminispirochaeta bajacaliforniensis TaxID=148 RepID=UPI00037AF93D|nr:HEAT repeat domain-containing protein [Sediminispirochaeta bajacaliforniensis]
MNSDFLSIRVGNFPVWAIAAAVLAVIVCIVVVFLAMKRRSAGKSVKERIDSFLRRPAKKTALWILEEAPDMGLFSVFLAALGNEKIATVLRAWIEASDDLFVFRRIALTGRGESFDGTEAFRFFSQQLDRIREMTGDPEWPARYMAVKTLLADDEERSRRALIELFHDPHPLIRRTLIAEFQPKDDREKDDFYNQLIVFLTDDTAFEVRSEAKKRLLSSFSDRYVIDFSDLAPAAVLHVVEQFDLSSTEDRRKAFALLEHKDLEIRFAAAQFLQESGSLDTLFAEADGEDVEGLKRVEMLLGNAVEVNVVGFLNTLPFSENRVSLQIAADLLQHSGDRGLIADLLRKVFPLVGTIHEENGVFRGGDPDLFRLFSSSLTAVRERGTESSVSMAVEELDRRCRISDAGARLILDALPAGFPHLVLPELLKILEENLCDETYRNALHDAFLCYSPSLYLDRLMDILKSGREGYAHAVRISALILLGKLKLTYCMQFLLEQMPVLPFDEARDFSLHLKEYAGTLFQQRVLDTLEKDDGKVRAALISAIPATGVKDFLTPIRDAVGDADPEVRRAAVWALLEYGDQKSIKSSFDLLRDPVERVRMEAARALSSKAGDSMLGNFENLIADENEVESVKLAAIKGLSQSTGQRAVDILVKFLKDPSEDLTDPLIEALSKLREKKQVKQLIEKMKDAGPELRERITVAFGRMGEEAEGPLLALLSEEIGSLTPLITEVLEATGYVEHAIRKLNHRDPRVRREAAETLSKIGTLAAFRGIVLAGRDPDQEVRVMVTKALEKLGTESGREILEALKEDPDKKIRKYTLWALERVEARSGDAE